MDSAPLDHLNCRKRAEGEGLPDGFSLLEMMMVVTLILMVVSIAQPIYHTAMVRARETVLADDLWTLRYLLDRFTADLGRSPRHLEEIVEKGYWTGLPTDPITRSNETWQEVQEKAPPSPTQDYLGIADIHSGSDAISLGGTPYNSW